MKTDFNKNLNVNEFQLICEILNQELVDLSPGNWRQRLFEEHFNIRKFKNLKSKSKVDINRLMIKLEAFSNLETLELLEQVDVFRGICESEYDRSGLISPQDKNEYILNNERHEAIVWTGVGTDYETFLSDCRGLNLEYIIYVQDEYGHAKSVWGSNKNELLDCFFTFSEVFHSGRIEKCTDALLSLLKEKSSTKDTSSINFTTKHKL